MAENNLYVEIHRPAYYPASWPCGRPTHYVVGRKPKTDDPVIDEIKGAWKAYHLDGSPFVKDDPATVCESCGGGYWPWANNFELVEEKDWPEWYRKLREAECADSQDDRAAR